MKRIEKKQIFICIIVILALLVLILGFRDKLAETRIEKQWAGQNILFCNKVMELLEPGLEFKSNEEMLIYFGSKEVGNKLEEIERLYFMKREFVEENIVLREKWETDNLGMIDLVRYKEYRTMRFDEEKNNLPSYEYRSMRIDYEYFDSLIDDIMSGRTAMKVPDHKYIEEAQESLKSYVMTEEGLSSADLEEILVWKMNPSLVK